VTAPPYDCPDELCLVGLLVERALRDGDIVGERGRRVLHDGDGVAGFPRDLVYALPAGAVDEPAWTRTMLDTASRFTLLMCRTAAL
jgi:hypothetical protein